MPHRAAAAKLKRLGHYPRTIALVVGMAVIAVVVYDVVDRANKNKLAIEKSCTLLNNAVIRSSASQTSPNSPTVPLIQGILEVIPQKYVNEYIMRSKDNTTVIPLINCEKVADHPESIHAEQLPTPPPRFTVLIPKNKR
jgi:hypothetical protein